MEDNNNKKLQEENDYIIRKHIMNNPEYYLNESLNNNFIICVILGGFDNFVDIHFYPDSNNKTFDIIINRYCNL